jgi:hypothetical protein
MKKIVYSLSFANQERFNSMSSQGKPIYRQKVKDYLIVRDFKEA